MYQKIRVVPSVANHTHIIHINLIFGITIAYLCMVKLYYMTTGVNEQRSNILTIAFVFGMVSVAIGLLSILFAYKKVLDIKSEYTMLHNSVNILRAEYNNLKAQKAALTPAVATSPATTGVPVSPKTEPEGSKPKEMIAAATNTTAESTKPDKAEAKPEEKKAAKGAYNVVVVYYLRRADNQALEATLRDLGYKFERKVADNNTFQKSNCVWFGAGVPLADVKRVVVSLIESGIAIKGVHKFPPARKNPSYKRNIIEVGMEPKYDNYSVRPLSVVEVQRAKSF